MTPTRFQDTKQVLCSLFRLYSMHMYAYSCAYDNPAFIFLTWVVLGCQIILGHLDRIWVWVVYVSLLTPHDPHMLSNP